MLYDKEIVDLLIKNQEFRDSITMKNMYDWGSRVDLQLRSTGYNEITLGLEDGTKVTLGRREHESVVLRFKFAENIVGKLEIHPTTYFYNGIERWLGGSNMAEFAINWVINQVIKSRLKTIFPECFNGQIIL